MSPPRQFNPEDMGHWNPSVLGNDAYAVRWIWDGFIPWPGITLLSAASRLGKQELSVPHQTAANLLKAPMKTSLNNCPTLLLRVQIRPSLTCRRTPGGFWLARGTP